jgi:hypothetical protein
MTHDASNANATPCGFNKIDLFATFHGHFCGNSRPNDDEKEGAPMHGRCASAIGTD